jgi:hypothetical protein
MKPSRRSLKIRPGTNVVDTKLRGRVQNRQSFAKAVMLSLLLLLAGGLYARWDSLALMELRLMELRQASQSDGPSKGKGKVKGSGSGSGLVQERDGTVQLPSLPLSSSLSLRGKSDPLLHEHEHEHEHEQRQEQELHLQKLQQQQQQLGQDATVSNSAGSGLRDETAVTGNKEEVSSLKGKLKSVVQGSLDSVHKEGGKDTFIHTDTTAKSISSTVGPGPTPGKQVALLSASASGKFTLM